MDDHYGAGVKSGSICFFAMKEKNDIIMGYEKAWIVIPTAMVKITDSGSVTEELLPVIVLDTYDSLFEYLRKEYSISDDNILSIKESFELYPAVTFPKSLKTPKFYKGLEIKWYRIEIYEATVIK